MMESHSQSASLVRLQSRSQSTSSVCFVVEAIQLPSAGGFANEMALYMDRAAPQESMLADPWPTSRERTSNASGNQIAAVRHREGYAKDSYRLRECLEEGRATFRLQMRWNGSNSLVRRAHPKRWSAGFGESAEASQSDRRRDGQPKSHDSDVAAHRNLRRLRH